MNHSNVTSVAAPSQARHSTPEETLPAQHPVAPAADARPASLRSPRDATLPPRAGHTPPANLNDLDANALSNVICASGPAGSSPALRAAASLARVCRQLRDAAGQTGLLPAIGQVLTESDLVLRPAAQASFEAQLPERAALLNLNGQAVLVNQLIDRFEQVPAGRARTLRFAALCRMATGLNPESATQSMTRLAHLVPLLPQDDRCTDRADLFTALLQQCSDLGVTGVEPLCALATHIPRLSDETGARATAVRALQARACDMAPAEAARLRKALIGPITCLENFQDRDDVVDATFAALDASVPPQQVAAILCDVARHLNLLTQPQEFRFDQTSAQSPEASALFDRICARARSLPAAEHAAVLTTLARLCGILPVMFQDDAIHQLSQQATGLPTQHSDAIVAELDHQEAVVWPDSASALLADQYVVAMNPSRNHIARRLGNLPENEQDVTLLALANSLDETIPAVARAHKFRAVFYAAELTWEPVHRAVLTVLMSKLDLLPAHFAGELAEKTVQCSLGWPPQERLAIVQAITAQLGHLNGAHQGRCADYLMMMSQAMTPSDRAAALRLQQGALQYVEHEDTRHSFAADLHLALMHRDGATRNSALPEWINKLTPFTAGSSVTEMLFSIHRETIQYQTDPVAKAAILQALAQGLGNVSDASQALVEVEIREAAQAMAPALGRPILDTLDLQRVCSQIH